MGIDRAVQLCRDRGAAPPTVRLYQWSRSTASLGRFQSVDSVDLEFCDREGIDVVRRPTGGRGVLHDRELTYSVIASESDGVPRGVAASYAQVSRALERAYRKIGVGAELVSRDGKTDPSGACYMQATRADLMLGGAKLSGSAQVWAGSTMLQHGSIVIGRDIDREAACFRLSPEQARALAVGTRTIEDVVEVTPDVGGIRRALIEGFESAFGIELVEGHVTAEEAEMAARLCSEFRISSGGCLSL
jgi:lipoate-protein ligase A